MQYLECCCSLTCGQVITLSDLECDYLNAQQCCYRLNLVSIVTFLLEMQGSTLGKKNVAIKSRLYFLSKYIYAFQQVLDMIRCTFVDSVV